MTPMQYQKLLRLQEARRLMLVEQIDAGTAGYGSATPANRSSAANTAASSAARPCAT